MPTAAGPAPGTYHRETTSKVTGVGCPEWSGHPVSVGSERKQCYVTDGIVVWFDGGGWVGYCFLRCAERPRPRGSGWVVSGVGLFSLPVLMGCPCAWVCVGVVCELDSVFVCLQFVLFLCLFLFLSFLVGVARLFPLLCWGVGGWFSSGLCFLFGEFDPGSGRTLAACLTHASRTMMRRLRR